MDNKTLEYMGERVDKARKLKNEIMNINTTYSIIQKMKEIQHLHIEGPCEGRTAILRLSQEIPCNVWNTEVKETLLKSILNYRDSIQHELDEL